MNFKKIKEKFTAKKHSQVSDAKIDKQHKIKNLITAAIAAGSKSQDDSSAEAIKMLFKLLREEGAKTAEIALKNLESLFVPTIASPPMSFTKLNHVIRTLMKECVRQGDENHIKRLQDILLSSIGKKYYQDNEKNIKEIFSSIFKDKESSQYPYNKNIAIYVLLFTLQKFTSTKILESVISSWFNRANQSKPKIKSGLEQPELDPSQHSKPSNTSELSDKKPTDKKDNSDELDSLLKKLGAITQADNPDLPVIIQTLMQIGELFCELGNYKSALEYYKKIGTYRPDSHTYIAVVREIADCYSKMGEYLPAIVRLQNLLHFIENSSSIDNAPIKEIQDEIALCYKKMDKLEKEKKHSGEISKVLQEAINSEAEDFSLSEIKGKFVSKRGKGEDTSALALENLKMIFFNKIPKDLKDLNQVIAFLIKECINFGNLDHIHALGALLKSEGAKNWHEADVDDDEPQWEVLGKIFKSEDLQYRTYDLQKCKAIYYLLLNNTNLSVEGSILESWRKRAQPDKLEKKTKELFATVPSPVVGFFPDPLSKPGSATSSPPPLAMPVGFGTELNKTPGTPGTSGTPISTKV